MILVNMLPYSTLTTLIILLTSNNSNDIQDYINRYFKLLEGYYNLNKLKLNLDKSKLMITCQPRMRESIKDIKLITKEYTVE